MDHLMKYIKRDRKTARST